ncbi:MAG TPA: methylenetetrahydrofolate reductase [Alphaproteobacteria bacterium]|nr:methylenetetrahydrofolate reductase [Alphaproteobacteria bacterium]
MARSLAIKKGEGIGDRGGRGERRTFLMRDWSVEATLPKAGDIEALVASSPADMPVYLSALAKNHGGRMIADAAAMRRAGLEPVPHVAVRNYESAAELEAFLTRIRAEADVRKALVIAGDRDRPAGPFDSALSLIASGMLEGCGIEEVGVSGYPDGHPKIDADRLDEALAAKIEAAARAGLALHVVTQFCFDPQAIGHWLQAIRAGYPGLPVRIGLAGPAGATTLLKFALRCGVKASARGLRRNLSAVGGLMGQSSPARIVDALAAMPLDVWDHDAALHFFSFGGIGRTARWVSENAAREAGETHDSND